MSEIKWLPKEAVLAMHARQLAEHGGGTGIRDMGLLDSALQRPLNKHAYESPDSADLAAAYAIAISQGHCFNDANKRTAFRAMQAVLEGNGIACPLTATDIGPVIIRAAQRLLDEGELAHWLRQRL